MTTLLRRLLPAPYVSAALFAGWLMMNQSLSPGNLVLAALFALVIPWITDNLRDEKPRPRKLGTLARLLLVVLKDIVMSNIEVAKRILGPESAIRPAFVWVPLKLRDPHAQVLLAGMITMTPGTLSAAFSDDRRFLLVHAFNMGDEAALVEDIQVRYEAPLIEVFDA
jgi:multicomponent K+:H+ antiporter subunit E